MVYGALAHVWPDLTICLTMSQYVLIDFVLIYWFLLTARQVIFIENNWLFNLWSFEKLTLNARHIQNCPTTGRTVAWPICDRLGTTASTWHNGLGLIRKLRHWLTRAFLNECVRRNKSDVEASGQNQWGYDHKHHRLLKEWTGQRERWSNVLLMLFSFQHKKRFQLEPRCCSQVIYGRFDPFLFAKMARAERAISCWS
jgi:hypothetical protein